MKDKDIEKWRYDNRAKLILAKKQQNNFNEIATYLETPYNHYFKFLEMSKGQHSLLEICAGMGERTGFLIDLSNKVCSTDLSQKSVEVMNGLFSDCANFSAEVADMEKLPFNDEIFNVVCCSGGLSYGDNSVVMSEIYRVLKYDGVMIVVDSLNNNPLYRFNRYIHYLRGNRSKSTLTRMPTINLINRYAQKFGYVEVKYFGAITWTFPLLSMVLTEKALTEFSNWIDATFNIKRSAFKFVMMAVKK